MFFGSASWYNIFNMNITKTAQAHIDQIKRQLKVNQFAIVRETVNQKTWVRLTFGDLFVPVACPATMTDESATLDYADPNFIIK